ncbi:hypothetical protein ABPG74_005054 [Tetrahymena malaccensis]
MDSRDEGCDSLFEEPQILNALFKYSILQTEQLKFQNFRTPSVKKVFYQPDSNIVQKILNDCSHIIKNHKDLIEKLPQKKLCTLEPHEQQQRLLLQNNISNNSNNNNSLNSSTNSLEGSIENAQSNLLKQPLVNPFQQSQNLVRQIEQLTQEFLKGRVYKCDQDADLKELESKYSENGGQSVREGNQVGSSDNLSNANNQEVLRYIQKRSRRPRADQIVKKVKEDTKNLLRNYGNAQSRFILNNMYSKRMMEKFFDNNQDKIEDFKKWVQQQKLENFEQFKNIWHVSKGEQYQEYKVLFREICFDFYENHASVYVLGSQMRSEDTRKTHIKYICRFLEGIVDPASFYYFKKN